MPGLSRRSCARSWSSCTAMGLVLQGQSAFTRPTVLMPVQVMTENPYRLARDIRGIGFKTADAIAMKLGIEKTAMVRARAGISYALTEAMDDGHCGLPRDELMALAVKLLEIPEALVTDALRL